jgi:xanthine dehydrogenase YagS FAD-binding subunit
MKEFSYHEAPDITGAVALLQDAPDARYLGGGTNLVDLMKLGVEQPELLIDINGLPLNRIETVEGGGLLIGATVSNSDLAADKTIRHDYPVLAQAILAGASGQLRNLATVGGNLMQRTRCAYFTDTTKRCNKRVPGSGCPAIEGEHHNHAILGASEHCVATHPSDLAVALSALDAVVHIHEPAGPRQVPVSEFYRPVGDTPDREVTVAPGSLITGVGIPALPSGARSRYRKVRERASFAFAIGSIAAVAEIADGQVRDVRIALGAVASRPWRARLAEQALIGGPADQQHFAAAADAELEHAKPLRDNAYKVELARNLIIRTLTDLVEEQR